MSQPTRPIDWPGEYRWCPMCRAELVPRQRSGVLRMSCPDCDFVHFRDPGLGAAVLVRDSSGRVLLVKRGPGSTRSGRWCIPCGYVDYGEDVREAAVREVREETGLEVELGQPIFVASNFHDPAKLSVGIWFEGWQRGGRLDAGDDAVDVGWFGLDQLPDLAFQTDRNLLSSL